MSDRTLLFLNSFTVVFDNKCTLLKKNVVEIYRSLDNEASENPMTIPNLVLLVHFYLQTQMTIFFDDRKQFTR